MSTETRVIKAKTADYTILESGDEGALFTTRGASGAVVFTLPTATTPVGWWCEVYVGAAQTVTVTAGTADTLTASNDLTADSIAWSTASEKVGNSARKSIPNGVWARLGTPTQ